MYRSFVFEYLLCSISGSESTHARNILTRKLKAHVELVTIDLTLYSFFMLISTYLGIQYSRSSATFNRWSDFRTSLLLLGFRPSKSRVERLIVHNSGYSQLSNIRPKTKLYSFISLVDVERVSFTKWNTSIGMDMSQPS